MTLPWRLGSTWQCHSHLVKEYINDRMAETRSIPVLHDHFTWFQGNHLIFRQYSCLENPMGRGAWWAAVHGVTRVGHDWATFLSLFIFMHWRRKWQPTPVFLPGESHGQRSLAGYSPWGLKHDWSHLTHTDTTPRKLLKHPEIPN